MTLSNKALAQSVFSANTDIQWGFPPFDSEAACVERALLDAGIDASVLKAQWGIVLWGLKVKGPELKLRIETTRPVDESALHGWFQHVLDGKWHVHLKFKPISACCHSACRGCLAGNPEKRANWLDF